MSASAIDVANRALMRVGAERITSFGEATNEAALAASEYEPLVLATLSRRRWRFATAEATLVRLQATPQSGRWEHAFQLPADLIALHNATVNGRQIDYDRLGDKLFTDALEPVVVEYTWRAPERQWPGHFADAFVCELTARFAKGLLRDVDLARSEERAAERAWQAAALDDSQQRTARRLPRSPLITVRRGRAWRWR